MQQRLRPAMHICNYKITIFVEVLSQAQTLRYCKCINLKLFGLLQELLNL